MQKWDTAGVRTERIVVDGRAIDAPLVVMKSGEILPLVLRFRESSSPEASAVAVPQEHHEAAESLMESTDLILRLGHAIKASSMEKTADRMVRSALELVSDAIQLYRVPGRDGEVHRLCAMITRQVRLGLLARQVRQAVFRGLKARNPKILYRRWVRIPGTNEKGGFLKDKPGGTQFVTELSKEYRGGRPSRPSGGHVYETVQAAARATLPVLQDDWEAAPAGLEKQGGAIEFLPIGEPSDTLEDFCEGVFPKGEASDSNQTRRGAYAYYGDEPHLCCALPSVAIPETICCETELHNSFITRWEPWGVEENSTVAAIALLLRDGKEMCQRMLCYGLDRRTHAQIEA